MFNYENHELLPHLDKNQMSILNQPKVQQTTRYNSNTNKHARENSITSSGGSLCSWSSSSSSRESRAENEERLVGQQTANNKQQQQQQQDNCVHLFSVPPPLVNNSALVRQRAKDHLAAATIATGASLPLMLGGRSKCIVNVLSGDEPKSFGLKELDSINNNDYDDNDEEKEKVKEINQLIRAAKEMSRKPASPKNTAMRAEQRRQNMSVSVVRPVISSTYPLIEPAHPNAAATNKTGKQLCKLEDSDLWPRLGTQKSSIIDDFMALDNNRLLSRSVTSEQLRQNDILLPGTYLLEGDFSSNLQQSLPDDELVKQQTKHQLLLFKREELELDRGIKRQHRFVVAKLAERTRGLQIVHSVWVQRDFKHAIEKLVDLYHQGLIFTNCNNNNSAIDSKLNPGNNPGTALTLSSLNTPIVVDVVSVIILRPKLWNLDICQLLLPILINDLLLVAQNNQQTASSRGFNIEKSAQYDYYTEVSLKALKLIINQFGSMIKCTLDSEKDTKRLLIGGVDLSREERLNKCLACQRLLIEARQVVANCSQSLSSCKRRNKLAGLCRDIQQSFEAMNGNKFQ